MPIEKRKINNKKSLVILGSLLIIVSFLLVGYKYINLYFKDKQEEKLIKKYYEVEENQSDVINVKEESGTSSYNYIAILRIPKINLVKGLVNKDSKYNNIEYNVAIHETSDSPDIENGNVILMSHSGTSNIAYFNNIKDLEKGDLIYLDYNNKTYTYKITTIYDVEKTGGLKLERNVNTSVITLITCRYGTNKQIIVIGEIESIK